MASTVLYRKYRPTDFKSLVGQDEVKNILVKSIQDSKFSQGYLFCGPRGTGKTTTARLVAKSINCSNFSKLGDACNECENCNMINNAEITDIVEMDGASNRSIDDIRNLKESLNFLPNVLKFKIFIIDEAHMLTKEAFNALLKTLEEPPSHVIFILATTESHKIPATILSRVVRFDFKLASENILIGKLDNIAKKEEVEIPNSVLKSIFKFSGGSFRDAESLLSKLISSGEQITNDLVTNILGIVEEDKIIELINLIKNGKTLELVNSLDEIIGVGKEPARILEQIIDKLAENLSDDKNITIAEELATITSSIARSPRADQLMKIKLANLSIKSKSPTSKIIDNTDTQKVEEKIVKIDMEMNKETIQNTLVETNEVSEDFTLESLVKHIDKKDPRLAAIIKDSTVTISGNVISGNVIKIANKYKFNLSYVDKPDSMQLMRSIFETVYNLADCTFITSNDKIDEATASKTSSSDEKKDNSPQEISLNQTSEIKKTKESGEDNSSIIESIL